LVNEHILASQLISMIGPPRLFDGDAPSSSGGELWIYAAVLVAAVALGWVLLRARRAVSSDERLGFLLLARRYRLKRRERQAVERLAERAGVAPVGLLVSGSAFARASRGERLSAAEQVEAKPVLLTGTDLMDLERVAQRLFGDDAVEPMPQTPDDSGEEAADETKRWTA
jgi:hypothetical protein